MTLHFFIVIPRSQKYELEVGRLFSEPRRRPLRPRGAWLTPTGIVWLGVSSFTLAAGNAALDVVLTLAGAWGLIVFLLTGIAATAHSMALRRDLRKADAEAKREWTGREEVGCRGLVSIPRRGWPLVLDPRIGWTSPLGKGEFVAEGDHLHERIYGLKRIKTGLIEREALAEDIFGLWKIPVRLTSHVAVRVIPDTGRYDRSRLDHCLSTGDLLEDPLGPAEGDRIDSRPYTRGDPARLILWKTYARSRRLLVRSPERARSPHDKPLIYFLSGPEDHAAAALIWFMLDQALFGPSFRFACSIHPEPTEDPAVIREVILDSGAVGRRAVEVELATHASSGSVIVVVPAVATYWQEVVLPLATNAAMRLAIIAAADLDPPTRERSRWSNALFAPEKRHHPTLGDVHTALEKVIATRCPLVFIDRSSGQVIDLGERPLSPARSLAE